MYELTPHEDQPKRVTFIEWVFALGKFVDLDMYTVEEVDDWYDRALEHGSGHIDPHGKTIARFVGVG